MQMVGRSTRRGCFMFTSHYFPKTRFYIFALAFGILFVLSGCKSAQLKQLETAASSIQPTMGQEVYRDSDDLSPPVTGFGPTPAEIYIEYEPINNHTKEDLYDEIVTILEENGWEGEECEGCRSASFGASLPPITARVRIQSNENLVSIRLKHLNNFGFP